MTRTNSWPFNRILIMNIPSFELVHNMKAWHTISAGSMHASSRSQTMSWTMSLLTGHDIIKFQFLARPISSYLSLQSQFTNTKSLGENRCGSIKTSCMHMHVLIILTRTTGIPCINIAFSVRYKWDCRCTTKLSNRARPLEIPKNSIIAIKIQTACYRIWTREWWRSVGKHRRCNISQRKQSGGFSKKIPREL